MEAPTGATRLAAVIGSPVRHSLSPTIHNAAFAAAGLDWVYVALEVAEGRVPEALAGMRALGVGGLSVTMPHKEAVADACDRLTDDAAILGAVNCVVPHEGELVGHNTDGPGFVAALAADGVEPVARRCVVLGAGGAARSVALALARAGAEEVAVVNRTEERARRAVEMLGSRGRLVGPTEVFGAVRAAELVVNATSVGMGRPAPDDLPVDPGLLHEGQVVIDLVYQPLETPLLAAARDRGAVTVNGLPMLVHQAAVAFHLWTGVEAPIAAMDSAVRASL
ncbi:MAG TPA: shikimate dehydrogenase [Acidimicrobiales bacterium]